MKDLADRLEAEKRGVQLDDDVETEFLEQIPRDGLDLVRRAPVERRKSDTVGDRLRKLEVGEPGQVAGQLRPQVVEQRPGLEQTAHETRDFVPADSLQVVSDADVEHGVQTVFGGEAAERARRLENLDEVGGLGVLAQGLLHSELLRPLDVEADVRRVDTGARDIECVVHLDGLELDDAASGEPREHDVLGELRVRSRGRAHGSRGSPGKVYGRKVLGGVGYPPLPFREVEHGPRILDFMAHPAGQVDERDRIQVGHVAYLTGARQRGRMP